MKHYKHIIKKLSDINEYESNSRTHSTEQVEQLARSIKVFGFTNPVLIDENSTIIAGHARCMAAAQLGMTDVPCVVVTGLDQHQKAALVIADNKLALNAGWDFDALKAELNFLDDAGFDLSLTGFDDTEIGDLMEFGDFDAGTENDQGQLDELDPIMITCPHCKKEFNRREVEE